MREYAGAQAMQLAHSGPVHIADLKVCRQRDTSRCKGSELCHRPSGGAGGRVGAEVRQRGGGCVCVGGSRACSSGHCESSEVLH